MLNRIVVSNSTPIIVLSRVDKLEILQSLYGNINIPIAVSQEVALKGDNLVQRNPWMKIKHVNDKLARDAFSVSLHSGEVEAMLLTRQLGADLLIIDDGLARKYAKRLNITITGTVGVILQAKNKGIIPRVKPILNDILSNGFFLSEQVRREILILANE
jgi:predicted nucleic acid-binding protein